MSRRFTGARCAEFLYPASWLADQTLYFRRAQRLEQRLGLDPPAVPRRAGCLGRPLCVSAAKASIIT